MTTPWGDLHRIAPDLGPQLQAVAGVEGVVLGGSRARGDHLPTSDYDVGLYHRGTLDIDGLRAIATHFGASASTLTEPGGWGPWVDGGGWLTIGDTPVDLIYRHLDRVEKIWADCQQGRYTNETQPGHPLGFWSHAYAGEVALAVPLSAAGDSAGEAVPRLHAETKHYPPALSAALTSHLWEASFSIANARKAIDRLDVAYVAGCLFRAAGVMAHAICGHDQTWLLNEKGAIAVAGELPSAPTNFADRVGGAFSKLAADPEQLGAACDALESVVDEAAQALA